jgi:hypothetical protein
MCYYKMIVSVILSVACTYRCRVANCGDKLVILCFRFLNTSALTFRVTAFPDLKLLHATGCLTQVPPSPQFIQGYRTQGSVQEESHQHQTPCSN